MAAPAVEVVTESVSAPPAPALRSFVASYTGYRYEGLPPGTHPGLPSRHLTAVISIADEVDLVVLPDRAQSPAGFQTLVGGLHATPATIRHDGHIVGVQLELTPAGSRALLGMPAAALGPSVVALDDLIGAAAGELVERLAAAASWPARFGVLDEVLARCVREPGEPPPEVARAWQRLLATGGTIEVGALAGEVGWSRRHLGERFRQEIGLTPKVAARVLRFERARRLLESGEVPGLAVLAATCGYYDQAHLTREFQDIGGCTPGAWPADELASLAAPGAGAPAGRAER